MLAIYIIASVTIFLIILLLFPIRVKIIYHEKILIKAYYLFFNLRIPSNKKKAKKKPKIEEQAKKERDNPPINEILKMIKSLIQKFPLLLRHISVEPFVLKLGIIGEDAAVTAISYGAACTGIYPTIAFINNKIKIKKLDINIYADYNSDKPTFEFLAVFKCKPIFILTVAIITVINYFIENLKNKKINKDGATK